MRFGYIPIWVGWETYDEDEGFVNGIKEDAPEEVKEAYKKHKEWEQSFIDKGEMIPR